MSEAGNQAKHSRNGRAFRPEHELQHLPLGGNASTTAFLGEHIRARCLALFISFAAYSTWFNLNWC